MKKYAVCIKHNTKQIIAIWKLSDMKVSNLDELSDYLTKNNYDIQKFDSYLIHTYKDNSKLKIEILNKEEILSMTDYMFFGLIDLKETLEDDSIETKTLIGHPKQTLTY